MRNFMMIVRCTACAVLAMVSGCVEYPEFGNADDGNNDAPLTRAQSDGKYYYAFDEKVQLNEVAGRVVVTFDKEQRSSAEEHILRSAQISKDNLHIEEGYSGDYSVLTIVGDHDKTALMEDLSKQAGVRSVRQVHALEDGYEMGYTNEIIMQLKDGVSQQVIGEMHKKFNVKIIKTSKLYALLSIPVEFDPLDVANAYQESGLTNYSHPNFINTFESYQSLSTDPYFNNQFYLRNTGQGVNGRTSTAGIDINVVPAWNITKGNPNIVVAVIDEGVTSNHPDLPNTRQIRLSGSNFGSGYANDPSPTGNDNHGNACAGIIAASHNGEGIAGIAPNCKILPIRIKGASIPNIVDAIELAAYNADVISWSGGWTQANCNLYPTIVDAIEYATSHGRRGSKGCVVVIAASNSADHRRGDNGIVAFPANVNISGVLTVGAVDRNGQQANYSPTSNQSSSQNQIIDVVAPSHKAYSWQISSETFDVWSIDIPSTAGYNYVHVTDGGSLPIVGSSLPNTGTNYLSYTGHFGGTSAAAPQVAGIAALLLSKAPDLTAKQVYHIITKSAANSTWNAQTGYGLVNAYAALSMLGDGTPLQGGSISTPQTSFSTTTSSNITLSNLLSPQGGSSLAEYQWQINFTDGLWHDMPEDTDLQLLLNSSGLSPCTRFRRRVISGSETAYSNVLNLSLISGTHGGSLYGNTTINGGLPVSLHCDAFSSPYNPNLTLIWEKSTNGINWFFDTTSSGTPDHSVNSLSQTTHYRVRIYGNSYYTFGYSNAVTITLN